MWSFSEYVRWSKSFFVVKKEEKEEMSLLLMNLRKYNGGIRTPVCALAGNLANRAIQNSGFPDIPLWKSPKVKGAGNKAGICQSSIRFSIAPSCSMRANFQLYSDGRRGMAKKGGKVSKKDQDDDEATVEEAVDTSKIISEMAEVYLQDHGL